MAPRRQSWPLDSSATTVRVTGIPVGPRLFTGELQTGGVARYSDSVWAAIEKGKTAYVHLKLGSSTGDAQICVEIEGFPLPANCRPPVPKVPDVSGCWAFSVPDTGVRDSLRLQLHILQRDSSLQAVLLAPDGRRDTARGGVTGSGWVTIGQDAADDFFLSVGVDSLRMEGKFFRRNGPPYQTVYVVARRGACSPDTVKVPNDTIPKDTIPNDSIPVPVDSLTCWDAAQTLGSSGRYLMLERNTRVYGLFQWAGYPDMPVNGSKVRVAGTGLALYVSGVLPPGMSRLSGRHDSVQYVGQLTPAERPTSIARGSVNGIDLSTGALGQLGEWKAYISACTVAERRALLGAHRL
jgi:hypothetical protein